ADLGGESLSLVLARAIPDHDRCARLRELDGDRAADPPRRAGDERVLPFQRSEAHDSAASTSCSSSSAARLFTETAFTLRSMRLTRPERTLPGPTSTNVRTPSRMSSLAACVNRTGAVSWSTRSGPMRCADSSRAVTVD